MDLSIELSGIKLINPVIAASGTFGYGEEFERFADLRRIGGICVKGTSARPIEGNLPPRLFPTASGMLNSIGLENVGVDAFIRDKMPFLRNTGCAVFVNVFGFNEDEYAEVIDKLNTCDGIAAYELNISCPNTKRGGIVFGQSPRLTEQLKPGSDELVRFGAQTRAMLSKGHRSVIPALIVVAERERMQSRSQTRISQWRSTRIHSNRGFTPSRAASQVPPSGRSPCGWSTSVSPLLRFP